MAERRRIAEPHDRDAAGRTAPAPGSRLETARRDSRLGYEWEQDYIYMPDHIQEKLTLIDVTLKEQIPAYRKRSGL